MPRFSQLTSIPSLPPFCIVLQPVEVSSNVIKNIITSVYIIILYCSKVFVICCKTRLCYCTMCHVGTYSNGKIFPIHTQRFYIIILSESVTGLKSNITHSFFFIIYITHSNSCCPAL